MVSKKHCKTFRLLKFSCNRMYNTKTSFVFYLLIVKVILKDAENLNFQCISICAVTFGTKWRPIHVKPDVVVSYHKLDLFFQRKSCPVQSQCPRRSYLLLFFYGSCVTFRILYFKVTFSFVLGQLKIVHRSHSDGILTLG